MLKATQGCEAWKFCTVYVYYTAMRGYNRYGRCSPVRGCLYESRDVTLLGILACVCFYDIYRIPFT